MAASPVFLLSTVESDSHTWNLVFLQLFLEEQDMKVVNLGACVPHRETIVAVGSIQPDVVIISSVNGHGFTQGRALFDQMRKTFGNTSPPVVIGGKLTTREVDEAMAKRELLALGYSGVFCGPCAIEEFRYWLANSWPLLRRHQANSRPMTSQSLSL